MSKKRILLWGLALLAVAFAYLGYGAVQKARTTEIIRQGQEAMEEKDYEKAIAVLSKVLHVHKAAEAELMTMAAYRRIGDSDRELIFLKESMKNRPDALYDTFRCSRIGEIYKQEQGAVERAKAHYKFCIQSHVSPSVLHALAEIHQGEGDIGAAIPLREKALKMMTRTDTYLMAKNKAKRIGELIALYNEVGRNDAAERLSGERDRLERQLPALGKTAVNEFVKK